MEGNPAYIWKAPREAERYMFSIHVKMWKAFVPRVLCVTAVVLLVVFGFLWNILPEDILASLKWGFLGIFGAAVLYCFLFLVYPLFSLLFGTGYEIDGARILRRGVTGDTRILWAEVTGYSVSEDQQVPDLVVITAHTKDRFAKAYAGAFNVAGLVLLFFFFILFELYHWSKIIKELAQ